MSEQPTFSAPVLGVFIAGATAVFALSLFLALTGSSKDRSYTTTTKSISAVGHVGAYELISRSGVPVARSFVDSIESPGKDGVLIMAEPPSLFKENVALLGRASNVLLILPKRTALSDSDRRGWVKATWPIDVTSITEDLQLIEPKAEVTRGVLPKGWVNKIGVSPSFVDTPQLIKSNALTPIVGDANGMLIGEKLDGYHRVWVMSDPDIIENHGLTKGENAAFVLAVVREMRGGSGKVVFDETIHGMLKTTDNPFRKIFEFPYVIVVLLGVVAAALLLWATVSRFGKPGRPPAEFDFGKTRLIGNTASLLERAGHHAVVMRRYVRGTLHDVGRMFHAPAQLGDEDLAAWLDTIGKARGLTLRSSAIIAQCRENGSSGSDLQGLFQAVRDIHKWKEMITDGTSARSSNR